MERVLLFPSRSVGADATLSDIALLKPTNYEKGIEQVNRDDRCSLTLQVC